MTDQIFRDAALATRSWLDYQAACGRRDLFSEHFLRQPLLESLTAQFSGPVRVERDHPQFVNTGTGRNRQIDYVVEGRSANRIVAALEVKWLNGKSFNQSLLDDIMRLECLRSPDGQGTARYLLVAGEREAVKDSMNRTINARTGRVSFQSQVLPHTDDPTRLSVVESAPALRGLYHDFASRYDVLLPKSLRITYLPLTPEGHHAAAHIWRIESSRNRATFDPDEEWNRG